MLVKLFVIQPKLDSQYYTIRVKYNRRAQATPVVLRQ